MSNCISNGVLKVVDYLLGPGQIYAEHLQWSIESVCVAIFDKSAVLQLSDRGVILAAPKPRERVEPMPKFAAAARARHMRVNIEVSKAL